MSAKLTNNATSTLSANISAQSTSLAINSADSSRFPALTAGEWFPLTLYDATKREIVRVVSRNGGLLTVQRAQEGTTAYPWNIGTRVDVRITAAVMTELENETRAKLPLIGGTITGTLKAANHVALRFTNGANAPAVIMRKDGSQFDIMLTDAGDADGSFNNLRPFRMYLDTGNIQFGHTVSALGEIQAKATNGLRFTQGSSPSVIVRKDSNNFYFLLTDAESPYGNFNALRPFYINLTNGRVVMNEGLNVAGSINITSGYLKVGDAFYYNNGAIKGSIWEDWHSSGQAKTAINARANEVANARINARCVTDTRYAGNVSVAVTSHFSPVSLPSGHTIKSMERNNWDIVKFYLTQLQIYIPNIGWRAAGTW